MTQANPGGKTKIAHVVFSSTAYWKNSSYYFSFIKSVEDSGLQIIYRWFDNPKKANPKKVYSETLKSIREADLMVAESSASSTGVGQQISYALAQKKPVIICINKKDGQNNMIFLKGTSSPYSTQLFYSNFTDLKKQLKSHLKKIKETKFEKFNFLSTVTSKNILTRESRKRGISSSELLREILDDWIIKHKH